MAILNYANISWYTTDSDFEVPATAGYNVGDGERAFLIPESRLPDIGNVEDIPGNTLSGTPGQWIFRIDETNVMNCPDDGELFQSAPVILPGAIQSLLLTLSKACAYQHMYTRTKNANPR